VASEASPAHTGLTVAVAGASGLIGQSLQSALVAAGHSVHRFVRRKPAGPDEHTFDPTSGTVDQGIIDHVDVVVNLSGASIGKIPWTKKHKDLILSSRIQSTTTLAEAIARSDSPPQVFVSASAVGVYGSAGDTELTEDSPAGDDFLARVTLAWEEAADAASGVTRVVYPRTGLVVGKGGAMAPLTLQTALFVGGKTGPGTQWWPWISLHDEVRAILHLITHKNLAGAYNLVGPTPARSVEVTKTLARLMRRPHLIGLPTFAIKAVMGEAGEHLLLSSQKISSQKLHDSGFIFDDVTINDALSRMLGREKTPK
jgi:uncharacterized protein (TIGR01777 family)